jgi:hypothetical protein
MVPFLASLLRFLLNVFSSRKTILSENAVLRKENEILLRKAGKKRVHLIYAMDFLTVDTMLGKRFYVFIDFTAYSLVSIRTAVEAPNMNSIMERFFRTLRREALDNFPLLGRDQIQRILEEYIDFYNSQPSHQGIQQQIPKP